MKLLRDLTEWAAFFGGAAWEGWRKRRQAKAHARRQLARMVEQQRIDTAGGVF